MLTHIPILPPLAEAMAAGPTGDLAFLCGASGRPYSKEGFANLFRRWCNEAGATGKELQAAFGWTSNHISLICTREADRNRLAETASMKRMANNAIPAPLGKVREKKEKY